MEQEFKIESFDPASKEDLKWLTKAMKKILEDVPLVKHLSAKLQSFNITHDPLDQVIAGLEKVTNITNMLPLDKKAAANSTNSTGNATGGADDNSTASGNATKSGAADKTDASEATADGAAATTGDAPEATKFL